MISIVGYDEQHSRAIKIQVQRFFFFSLFVVILDRYMEVELLGCIINLKRDIS